MLEILIVVIVFFQFLILTFLFFSKKDRNSEETLARLKIQEEKIERSRIELNNLLINQNNIISKEFNKNSENLIKQFDFSQNLVSKSQIETANIVKNVTEKLISLEKTNEKVIEITKQLQSFENLLKSPKQRGILGEYYLENSLKNVLPGQLFQMQYKFKNSEIVDAVIFIKDKLVPIDSKFSLENYNKILDEKEKEQKISSVKSFKNDIKKRVIETSKYIRPEENTTDFAFMFLPSEGIYYDILTNRISDILIEEDTDLLQWAFLTHRVVIVSPNSFLAYLQTVLQALKTLEIEESAKFIKENVLVLAKHLKSYETYFFKVGNHLENAVSAYEKSNLEFKKIGKDVITISNSET